MKVSSVIRGNEGGIGSTGTNGAESDVGNQGVAGNQGVNKASSAF